MRKYLTRNKTAFTGGVLALTLIAAVGCSSGSGDDGGDAALPTVAPATGLTAGTVISPGAGASVPGLSDLTRIASVETSGAGVPVPSLIGTIVPGGGSTQQVGISVSGSGAVAVEPDIATLSLRVESRETTVTSARQIAAEAMTAVRDALKGAGVADDDIVTNSFSIQPQTTFVERTSALGKFGESVIVGYIVSNQVSVKIRDLDRVGEVIDAAAAAAGDEVRINGINFGLDDPDQFGAQARELAARDAREKAGLYARTLGVELGPVVFLQETGGTTPSPVAAPQVAFASGEARSFAPTPVSSGDVNVSASVSVVFAIVIPGGG